MQQTRIERGMTEAQLAAHLKVRQSMVSMIESGEDLEDGVRYSADLARRIREWIVSGAGPTKKAKRGPYAKKRVTIKK